jgi:hypothetical protein
MGDVFNPFAFVYKEEEHLTYEATMKVQYGGSKDLDQGDNLVNYFRHPWRKNQISDHFPIWFELTIDSSVSFLQSKRDALSKD